jgi:hypothetical protein
LISVVGSVISIDSRMAEPVPPPEKLKVTTREP